MRIGIIGGGTVGRAVARTYLEWTKEVRIWDIIPERRTSGLTETLDTDITFICLPTPSGNDGRLNIKAVWDICGAIVDTDRGKYRDRNYVLKSTVPIGTTRKLRNEFGIPNLVHSPEFLTARCANSDSMIPACNIIGVPTYKWPLGMDGLNAKIALENLYNKRYPGVQCKVMSSDESEATKLFTNGFYAVKVAFFNEIRCLADKLELNWDTVVSGMLAQGRIAPYHYLVPGPDGKRGFGGDCLPKDLTQLIQHMSEEGTPSFVTDGAKVTNRIVRKE